MIEISGKPQSSSKNKQYMKTRFLFLALAFMLILKVGAQTPLDSLVAFYPFSGNANDESINNNHGTLIGATLYDDRFGYPNSSLYFDGIDDRVLFNDVAFDFDSVFSISFWMKTSSTGSDQRLFHKSANSPNRGWFISLNRSEAGKLTFFSSENGTDFKEFTSDSVFNDDNWNHIVFVYDGSNNISKFYKNNNPAGIDPLAYARLNTNDDTLSVSNSNYPSNYAEGIMDDIRIFNRVLDSVEVSELYSETVCSRIIFDTTEITTFDTVHTIIYDTTYVTIYDTTYVTVYDSNAVTDTLIIDVTITGVNAPNNINTLKVFPNPAKDILNIYAGDQFASVTGHSIKILDLMGVLIYESNLNQQLIQIDINDFGQTGLFFIQLINDSGQIIEIKKILLE